MDPIQTLINLNGTWASGNVPGPVMTVSGNAISVNMGAYQRPSAQGTILDTADITVTFPDDKTYTGKLQTPNSIIWSNGSEWTKASVFIVAIVDLNGTWASGGVPGAVISVWDGLVSVDMSAYHRPQASGSLLDPAHLTMDFPDDKTYTARISPPGTIYWSNDSAWTKVPITIPTAPSGLHLVSLAVAPGQGASTITVGWVTRLTVRPTDPARREAISIAVPSALRRSHLTKAGGADQTDSRRENPLRTCNTFVGEARSESARRMLVDGQESQPVERQFCEACAATAVARRIVVTRGKRGSNVPSISTPLRPCRRTSGGKLLRLHRSASQPWTLCPLYAIDAEIPKMVFDCKQRT